MQIELLPGLRAKPSTRALGVRAWCGAQARALEPFLDVPGVPELRERLARAETETRAYTVDDAIQLGIEAIGVRRVAADRAALADR